MSSAVEPQAAANPQLPLWDTICFSYFAYFSNFRDLLRTSWLWLLVVAEVAGIANWIKFSLFAEAVARIEPPIPPRIQVQFPAASWDAGA